jgi:hypothetical protein
MPQSRLELIGIGLEGVQGFSRAFLALDDLPLLLAGPNNAGKSGILKTLHWALTGIDEDLVDGRRTLTSEEKAFLHPATRKTGMAQRISLWIRLHHASTRAAFDNRDGVAVLRIHVAQSGFYMAIESVSRGEKRLSTDKARRLYRRLLEQYEIYYLPVGRDSSSGEFDRLLASLVRERLEVALIHNQQGGARSPARTAGRAVTELQPHVKGILQDLWHSLLNDGLVREMVASGSLPAGMTAADLVEGLVASARLKLVTGSGDDNGVDVAEVGAGLQSALVFSAAGLYRELGGSTDASVRRIVLVEEPETFLHPALQRSFARLFDKPGSSVIATTHSSLVCEDFPLARTIHLRSHQLFRTSAKGIDLEKHEWLKHSVAGEPLFYDAILLVEGPGDAAFFEALRRRYARSTPTLNRAHVVAVGGKTSFGKWLRLLRNFERTEPSVRERDLVRERGGFTSALVLADGADAVPEVARALTESGFALAPAFTVLANTVGANTGNAAHVPSILAVNSWLAANQVGAMFLQFDLEYAIVRQLTAGDFAMANSVVGSTARDRLGLARHLGSKAVKDANGDLVVGDAKSKPAKEDWIRAAIGSQIAQASVAPEVLQVLEAWWAPLLGDVPFSDLRI